MLASKGEAWGLGSYLVLFELFGALSRLSPEAAYEAADVYLSLPVKLVAPTRRTLRVAGNVAELAAATYDARHAVLAAGGGADQRGCRIRLGTRGGSIAPSDTYILPYVCTAGGMVVGKVKVTLSLRGDLVRSLKSKLALEGRTLSEVVEESLTLYEEAEFLERLCEALGLEKRYYTGPEVEADRPRGLRSEEAVREVRDERAERLPGH